MTDKTILQYFRNPNRRVAIEFKSEQELIIIADLMGVMLIKSTFTEGFVSFSTGNYHVSMRGYGCYHYDTVLSFQEFVFVVSDICVDIDKILNPE